MTYTQGIDASKEVFGMLHCKILKLKYWRAAMSGPSTYVYLLYLSF
jgi:hypothetical protein